MQKSVQLLSNKFQKSLKHEKKKSIKPKGYNKSYKNRNLSTTENRLYKLLKLDRSLVSLITYANEGQPPFNEAEE